MGALLGKYPGSENIVYCDNGNEAYGAMVRLWSRRKTIGTKTSITERCMIVAFDAAKKALSYVRKGLIACDGECNPFLGPSGDGPALEEGKSVEKIRYVDEGIYAGNQEIHSVIVDGKTYPVTPVTQDLLEKRVY